MLCCLEYLIRAALNLNSSMICAHVVENWKLCLCCLAHLCPLLIHGSMNNGDRFTGNNLRLTGGKLLLKTDYGGDITPVNAISTFESEQEPSGRKM